MPAALVVGGALILLRELRPPGRPLRTGTLCLVVAITLALAAGTLGLGPGAASSDQLWRVASMEARGGILGAGEYWVAAHLISHAGADILAVFLLIAGAILVSGAGLAGVLRATGTGVASTGRALRDATGDLRTRHPATAAARVARALPGVADDRSDEPESFDPLADGDQDTAEIVVRATHVEAPAPEELPLPEDDDDPLEKEIEEEIEEESEPIVDFGDEDDSEPGAPEVGDDPEPGRGGPVREVDEDDLTPPGPLPARRSPRIPTSSGARPALECSPARPSAEITA